MIPIRVFISYCHANKVWLAEWQDEAQAKPNPRCLLKQWERALRKKDVSFWHDREENDGLRGGDSWRNRIFEEIDKADIAVLFLTQDFVLSPFIMDEELPRIIGRFGKGEMTVLPVLLQPIRAKDMQGADLNEWHWTPDDKTSLGEVYERSPIEFDKAKIKVLDALELMIDKAIHRRIILQRNKQTAVAVSPGPDEARGIVPLARKTEQVFPMEKTPAQSPRNKSASVLTQPAAADERGRDENGQQFFGDEEKDIDVTPRRKSKLSKLVYFAGLGAMAGVLFFFIIVRSTPPGLRSERPSNEASATTSIPLPVKPYGGTSLATPISSSGLTNNEETPLLPLPTPESPEREAPPTMPIPLRKKPLRLASQTTIISPTQEKVYEVSSPSADSIQTQNWLRNSNVDDLIRQKRYNEANQIVEEILKKDPINLDNLMRLGKIQRLQNKFDDAGETFKMVSYLKENYAPAFFERAEIYCKQNQFDRAISYYQKALEADPKCSLAELGIARVYKSQNKILEYTAHLSRARKLDPDSK